MDADYLELYGADAAQGMQVHPRRFWSCFSGPAGILPDVQRGRLLRAYKTIPEHIRTRFLSRLHSEDQENSMGAWAELEVVDLALRSNLNVIWTDERTNSKKGYRSVDLEISALGITLPVEVTHYKEASVAPEERQISNFFGAEHVPAGLYELAFGQGQAPITRLRSVLRRRLKSAPLEPIDIQIDNWGIRQLTVSEFPDVDKPNPKWNDQAIILLDRIQQAMKAKRRQAREAGYREVAVAVILVDRHSHTLIDLLAQHPEWLTSAISSSSKERSELLVRAVAVGALVFEEFPPEPK